MFPENLIKNIIAFAFEDQGEWELALEEFYQSLDNEEPTEEELDQFETDYVFSRKHSVYNKTFIRLFVECYEELYGKEWSKDIVALEENFNSYFEILKIDKDHLMVKDLLLEDTFTVDYPSLGLEPNPEDIIHGNLFPWKGEYFFFGPIIVYEEEEAKEAMQEFTFVIRDSYQNTTSSFLEYFGDNIIIFKDYKELEDKVNQFMYWFFRNKIPQGIFTDEEKENLQRVTFDDLEGEKEIGLIIDHGMGQILLPGYGYAVKLLSGQWDKVPNYQEKARTLLYQEEIPSYFVKELIENNAQTAVELYSQLYPVKTKEDLLTLFSKCRRDWARKPRRQGPLFEA
jgi:hypothetical protein